MGDFRLPMRSGREQRSLGYYAASSDYLLQTFRDNISVPSSGGQHKKK